MSQLHDSSFGLIVYKNKLLVMLRDNKPTILSPNTWHLIGGGRDKDETPLETYKREVKEEVSIIPSDIHFLFIFNPDGKDRHMFHSKLTDQEVKNLKLGDEGQKLDFFSLEELDRLDLSRITRWFTQEERNLLQKLLENST